jgi:hypothetical protein
MHEVKACPFACGQKRTSCFFDLTHRATLHRCDDFNCSLAHVTIPPRGHRMVKRDRDAWRDQAMRLAIAQANVFATQTFHREATDLASRNSGKT